MRKRVKHDACGLKPRQHESPEAGNSCKSKTAGKMLILPGPVIGRQAENSRRTISAPAPKAFSLPLAMRRDKGAMPHLVEGQSLSAPTN
ncbi:hypothetical protein [Niveispirillum fermenti]|uniref:hypothetical protein n=1 Tax=Niveispirillum fermenti TaxID=1233113 RepID=UPI003A89EC3E